jgi:hypothetical protein
MGTWHDYNPTWQVDGSHGSIEVTGGVGDFLFHAEGVGWIQLRAFVGQTEHTFLVNLLPGRLDDLVITAPESGTQGETVQFTVEGFDVSGYPVAIPACDVNIVSTAGEATCENDVWTLNLENHGPQQSIRATYDGAEGKPAFIDVQSTLLSGQLGTSEDVMALGSVFVGLLIAILLVLSFRRAGRLADDAEYEDDDADEHEPIPAPAPVPGLRGMPQPAAAVPPIPPGIVVLPPGQMPPPAAAGAPPPPSPAVARAISGQRGKRSRRGKQSAPKPAAPPPAFLFGRGLAANSTTAALPQPQPGVFVQSKPEYGWGDAPPHPGPSSDEYGWGAGTGPQAPPPAAAAPAAEVEEGSDLSSALAAFGTAETEEAEVVEDAEEVDDEPDAVETEAEAEGGEAVEDDGSEDDGDDDSEDEAESDEHDDEQDEMDAELESDEDSADENESELGDSEEWASDWDDEPEDPWAESDMAEDGSEEAEEGELEGESPEPGLGPMTEDGELLKPLPGTRAGESGWYLFSDGKPSLWEFRAVGWERVE